MQVGLSFCNSYSPQSASDTKMAKIALALAVALSLIYITSAVVSGDNKGMF